MQQTAENKTVTLAQRRRFYATGAALLALGMGAVFAIGEMPQAARAATATPVLSQGVGVSASFADVVEKVKPAVVSVRVKSRAAQASAPEGDPSEMFDLPPDHPLRRFFDRMPRGGDQRQGRAPRGLRGEGEGRGQFAQSQGSGFFISADGYVVTNNHVVENGVEVQVVTDDGRTLPAKIIGTDPRTDLAVLKVEEKGDFPFVKLAGAQPRVGDWVIAVGNPFGLGGTVTAGIVSARGRDIGAGPYDDFLQIDAPVNRGNSGGPTFNLNGEVVGVNTAIASPSGGSVGIAFAIPAETASRVVASLKDTGSVARGFLGVQIQPVTPEVADAIGLKEAKGALVASAEADTPAAKAGLKRGDTIIALDGKAVQDARDLTRRIGAMAPGSNAEIKFWREGKEQTLSVKLGKQPQT